MKNFCSKSTKLCKLCSCKWSGVGVWLALRTLVCKVKRTLAMVGSWIGVQLSLSTKYGLIPGPRNNKKDDWKFSCTLFGRVECVRRVYDGRCLV